MDAFDRALCRVLVRLVREKILDSRTAALYLQTVPDHRAYLARLGLIEPEEPIQAELIE